MIKFCRNAPEAYLLRWDVADIKEKIFRLPTYRFMITCVILQFVRDMHYGSNFMPLSTKH